MQGVPLLNGLNTVLEVLPGLQTKSQSQLSVRDRQFGTARSTTSDFRQTLEQSRGNGVGNTASKSSAAMGRTTQEERATSDVERSGRQQSVVRDPKSAENENLSGATDTVSSMEVVKTADTENETMVTTDADKNTLHAPESQQEPSEEDSDLTEILFATGMFTSTMPAVESASELTTTLEVAPIGEMSLQDVEPDAETPEMPLVDGYTEQEAQEQNGALQVEDALLLEKAMAEGIIRHNESSLPFADLVAEAATAVTQESTTQQAVVGFAEHPEKRTSLRMEVAPENVRNTVESVPDETLETVEALQAPDAETATHESQASLEQSLRAEHRSTTSTHEVPAVERQHSWNFHQIMAEQTQSVQPSLTMQTVGSMRGGLVAEQVNHWLQELDASNFAVREGKVTQLEVTLEPRNLGKLVLKLEMENGELRAYFATQSQIVKQTLESQMSSLKDLLLQQGLHVSQLNVHVGDGRQQQNETARDGAARGSTPVGNADALAMAGVSGEAPIMRVGDLWNRLSGSRFNLHV